MKSLADGKTKLAILTSEPEDPTAPTPEELTAGIDASCGVLASDFTFGATDSDKVAEKPLCQKNNSNALGAGNYTAGITAFREFDDTDLGQADAVADAVFAAAKTKGTELWVYARRTAKDATAAWASDDEVYLGARVLTDTPQPPSDAGGYIKARIPMEVQEAFDYIAVA